ncbi:rab-GTPase-TBC domain-containing protein [Mycotypha africana]|uniref:rab-GTPase-TBC domain-containing protein n=1 Tax=Mycotypha africana TaxID=64632 RepID=UPI0022FFF767|nr:rab-GTPase-TBC domain-containing protein [Mycotypha africana]KAI8992169.1 rab-GTPase-TBC domain-containing protein [Mycotypha africana]
MYLQGERIIVLKHIQDDTYLGYCEGVIGNFNAENVHFVELDPRVLESLDADYTSDIMTAEGYHSSNRNSNNSSNHQYYYQQTLDSKAYLGKPSFDSIGTSGTASSLSAMNTNNMSVNNSSAFQSPHSSHISTVSYFNNSSLEDQLIHDYSNNDNQQQLYEDEDPYDTTALNIDYSDEEEMAHFSMNVQRGESKNIPPVTDVTPNTLYNGINNIDRSSIAHSTTTRTFTSGRSTSAAPQPKNNLTLDEYGFIIATDQQARTISRHSSTNSSKQKKSKHANNKSMKDYRETELKWLSIVSKLDAGTVKRDAKLKKLVRQGIPASVRPRVWQFLAGSIHSNNNNSQWIKQLLSRPRIPIYDVIERDIARCYPDHVQFMDESGQGQKDLSHLLKAYAQYNPELEYCQGMGRLAGLMLMHMSLEDAFSLFVATIDRYMNGYFTPTLSQLHIDAYIIGQLLEDHQPKLAHHLQKNEVLPIMYIAQWFLTAFTMTLPWESVLRVWDAFYFEGIKVFYRVSLAILELCKEHLLTACPTSSELLAFLLHIPHQYLEPHVLLETAFRINLSKTDIKKYAKKAGTADDTLSTFGLPFEHGIKNLQVGGISNGSQNGGRAGSGGIGLAKPFQNSLGFKKKS